VNTTGQYPGLARPPALAARSPAVIRGGTAAQNPGTTPAMSYQSAMPQLPPATGVLLLTPTGTAPAR